MECEKKCILQRFRNAQTSSAGDTISKWPGGTRIFVSIKDEKKRLWLLNLNLSSTIDWYSFTWVQKKVICIPRQFP